MLRTKRWDDPIEPDDGARILITRYRPRALPKSDETWTIWERDLAPSSELLAAFQGKSGTPISWTAYTRAYQKEMRAPQSKQKITELAQRLAAGETITLLCSSQCTRESRCHRSLLRALIEAENNR